MLFWSQIPLLRAVIPFSLGIIATSFQWAGITPLVLSFIIIGLCLIFSIYSHYKTLAYQKRWIWGLQINLLLFFIGFSIAKIEINQLNQAQLPTDEKVHWIGVVDEISKTTDSSTLAIVKLSSIIKGQVAKRHEDRIQLYLKSDKELQRGDEIMLVSYFKRIAPAKNPSAFDYAAFMRKRGVLFQTFAADFKLLDQHWSLQKSAESLRKQLIENYQKMGIQGDQLAVLVAISLGDKNHLDSQLKEKYAGAGAMHILAVSGLHVGIVYLLFAFLLQPLEKLRIGKFLKGFCLLLLIWSFAMLTGFSPSVQRAALMFSFIAIAKMFRYETNVLNSIAASAFLILLIEPMMIFEVGFQLSYAAVIGIVCLHPILYEFWTAPNRLLDYAWSLMMVSIAAQLATLPFVLYYFHQFPIWFLLTNLMVIPLAFFIVAAAVFVGIFYFLFGTALGINYLLLVALFLLNYGIDAMSNLPFFVASNIWISLPSAILLAFVIVLLMAYLNQLKVLYLKIALGMITLLIGIESTAKLLQSQKRSFGIYATNGSSLYVFIDGLEATVFVEDSLKGYPKTIVDNHLYSVGIQDYKIKELKEPIRSAAYVYLPTDNYGLFSFDDVLILFHNKQAFSFVKNMCNVDYLILKEDNKPQFNKSLACSLPILLDGSITSWNNKFHNLSKRKDVLVINTEGYYSIP